MQVVEEKTYEMFWDCEYCGHKKMLGLTHRYCANCGAPQNPEKRYFPPEDEKVAVQDHEYVGADLHCPACGEAQSAKVKHCTNCGSPLDGGKSAVTHQAAPPPQPQKSGGGGKGIIFAIVGLVVVVIGFFVVRSMWTETAEVKVDKLTWTREIAIEKKGEFEEKSACKSVPKGAKITKRSKAEPVCKTKKVDQGDGTFKEKKECSDPVEQCTYKVMKWKEVRKAKASGGEGDTPTWPSVKLARTGDCEGCERKGDKSERYVVHFTDGKDDMTCGFSNASDWKRYAVGDKYTGEKRVIGGGLDCDSLKAK